MKTLIILKNRAFEPKSILANWVKHPFCVHRKDKGEGTGYALSHIPSGCRIADVYTVADGRFIANFLYEKADWTFTEQPEYKTLLVLKDLLSDAFYVLSTMRLKNLAVKKVKA